MPIFARQRRAPYKVKNRRMGVRLSVTVTQKRRSIISREESHRPQMCVAAFIELLVRVAHGLGLASPQHDLKINSFEAVVLITVNHAGRA